MHTFVLILSVTGRALNCRDCLLSSHFFFYSNYEARTQNFNHKIYKRTPVFPSITLNFIFNSLHAKMCGWEKNALMAVAPANDARRYVTLKSKRGKSFWISIQIPSPVAEISKCKKRREKNKKWNSLNRMGEKSASAEWKRCVRCGESFNRINFVPLPATRSSDLPNPCCTLMNNHILSHAAVCASVRIACHSVARHVAHLQSATRLRSPETESTTQWGKKMFSWLNFI